LDDYISNFAAVSLAVAQHPLKFWPVIRRATRFARINKRGHDMQTILVAVDAATFFLIWKVEGVVSLLVSADS